MDTETFWIAIWKIAATAFVVLIGSFSGCTAYQSHLIASSADPVAAACAVRDQQDQTCLVVASRLAQ